MNRLDPIGAWAAGAQIKTAFERVDLAQQAQRSSDMFDFAKLGLQREFDFAKLGLQREEDATRTDLAKQQMEIAKFNAQTNRMNAERAVKKAAGSDGGTGINIWSALKTDAEGLYFDPSALQGSAGTEATTPSVASAEGGATSDGASVMPLPAGTGGSGTPRQLPDAMAGALPLPTGGAPGGAAASPLLPSPGGAAAPAAPASAPAAGSGAGKLRLEGININAKGQPSLSFKAQAAKDAPNPPVTPEFLAELNKKFEHLGGQFVPDVDSKGKLSYAWQKTDTLGGFSVSDLPADIQKGFQEDVLKMIEAGTEIENPSDQAKMQAAGIDPKDKNAAKLMLERGLWDTGYAEAKKQKENELVGMASTYAKKWNAQFSGKKGFVPKSGLDVLRDIGISSVQPQQAAAQQATPSTASQPKQTANGERNTPTAAPAGAPTAATAVAKSATPAGAPSEPDTQGQIKALEGEIATEQNPTVKRQKENFLAALKQRQPAAGSPAAKAATPADDYNREIQRNREIASKAKADITYGGTPAKEEATRIKWQDSKLKLLKALNATGVSVGAVDFLGPRPPASIAGARINSVSYGMDKWLAENKDKTNIKPMDGKPLGPDSPIFIDHMGRTIKLREIYRALLADTKMNGDQAEQTDAAAQVQKGASPEARAVLDRALGAK